MSGLVPLQLGADLNDPVARGALQESLELMANRIRLLTKELELVKDADKIVRPVPVESFPVAAGQIYTGEEGGDIGDIIWRAVEEQPVGTLLAHGTAVSRTTYSDLFAKIGTTFNTGGELGTQFRLPDLRGRTMVGASAAGVTGDAGGATSWTLGLKRGDERTEAHDHAMPHTHEFPHTHGVPAFNTGGGGGNRLAVENLASTLGHTETTSSQSTTTTGGSSAANTSTSLGGTDKNVQPSLGLVPYIRHALGPTDTIQTLPINWGEVNGQWQIDTIKNFPTTGVQNLDLATEEQIIDNVPEAVVRIAAVDGGEAGSTGTSNRIIGVTRVPYNFRAWRPNALVIRTRVNSTGITGGDSCTITLRVSDPLSPGSYLSAQFSRTIEESGNEIADETYVDAVLTAEDLGRTWKPGYMLRFELIFDHPRTFDTAALDVGLLKLNWR